MVLLSAIEAALASEGVTRKGESRVLVACSGGADSVALAHATCTLLGARRVILGHVDHRVRPGSEKDAAFVEDFAHALGAEVRTVQLAPGMDDEATLRDARYAALDVMRAETAAEWILTAHTADDQAETVLLGLLRTSRLEALGGMPGCRGRILRPLLDVSRASARHYAHVHHLRWREDPTNLEPRYLRNRIRKELLPLLERRYRPRLVRRLVALAGEVRRIHDREPAEGMAKDLRPLNRPEPPPVVGLEGPDIRIEHRAWPGGHLPDGKQQALFDAALLERPVLRRVRAGDRIRPFGMNGTKKLQDLFVDQKVPRDARTWVWVVALETGEVVWVPRLLRSAAAPISSETREVWIFTCVDATLEDGS